MFVEVERLHKYIYLKHSNLKKKKSLGQHFLKDQVIVFEIANSLIDYGRQYNFVLEVGGGDGVLTGHLLQYYTDHFKVVELDSRFALHLATKYNLPEGQIINESFLNLDLNELFGGNQFGVIGNFPYQISTEILFKIQENKALIPEVVGMFQKEVAYRIAASHGNRQYGVTSVLIQLYYDVVKILDIGPESFDPPPRVNSAVIRLTHKEKVSEFDYRKVRKLVKLSFNQRRKTLRNALKSLIPDNQVLENPFYDQRAEQLSVDDFVQLSHDLSKYL
jgi:16S rRNA (adenine1518-N6/adenine1519-N6)-dimethyltransferase